MPGLKAGQIHIRAGSFVCGPAGGQSAHPYRRASIVAISVTMCWLSLARLMLRAGDVLIVIGTEDGSPGSNRSSKAG